MKLFAYPLFVIFVVAAVFGVYIFLGPMHSGMGCPFMPGETALCAASILEHLGHWQSAFAATLASLLVLCAFALLFVSRLGFFDSDDRNCEKYRVHARIPVRPTLFQELFARGILNPKVF